MQDMVLKEIKNKMYDYEKDWVYDEVNDVYMHPTNTFCYGSLSEDMMNKLEEINLEEVFLKDPKPSWIFHAFRECDLLILNSFLTLVKAFIMKGSEKPPCPLVFKLDNGKYIMIAQMEYNGDLSEYKRTPAWYMHDSMLFTIASENQE